LTVDTGRGFATTNVGRGGIELFTLDAGTALWGRVPVESVLFARLTAGFALAGLALTADFALTVGFTPTAGLEAAFALPKAGLDVALRGFFGAENAGLLAGRF